MDKLKLKIAVMLAAGLADVTAEDVDRAETVDYLSENVGRDGKTYIWYFDGAPKRLGGAVGVCGDAFQS